jgi:hypothetical protein
MVDEGVAGSFFAPRRREKTGWRAQAVPHGAGGILKKPVKIF